MKRLKVQLRRLNRPSAEVAYLQDSVQMALDQIISSSQFIDETTVTTTTTGAAQEWGRLTTQMPLGVSTACVLNYQFDGSADHSNCRVDSSNDLTSGGREVTAVINGQIGAGFDTVTGCYYSTTSYNSALEITRACTVEIVLHQFQARSSAEAWLSYQASGESTTSDALWWLFSESGNSRIRAGHEASAGAIVDGTDCQVNAGLVPGHGWTYIAATRADDGLTYNLYVDGVCVLLDTSASPAYAPDDPPTGTSRRVYIGASVGGAVRALGAIQSVRVTPAEFSAASVLNQYQRLRGLA